MSDSKEIIKLLKEIITLLKNREPQNILGCTGTRVRVNRTVATRVKIASAIRGGSHFER